MNRSSRLLVAVAGVLSLLLFAGDSYGAKVFCLHTDGTAAVEDGTERCCAPAAFERDPSRSRFTLEAQDGDCPGCTDIFLAPDYGRASSGSKSGRTLAPTASFAEAPRAISGDRTRSLMGRSRWKGGSPPRTIPLRI